MVGLPRYEGDSVFWPYFRFGIAGLGNALIRFYRHTGDEKYLRLCEKFLDMFCSTKDGTYLDWARNVARKVLLFRVDIDDGIAFPDEELLRISNSYGTGSSGIGLFLERLSNPSPRLFYDLV